MTTHDNVTDIVERDHIKETTETLFRIAINATMPKENEAKWCQALQYAGAMLEKQQADLATLRKQLENARSEALEEAAVRVGELFGIDNHVCDAIRLLKGQP